METTGNTKKERSFLRQIIALCLSACILSMLVLGLAQILLSASYFTAEAQETLDYYLESTNLRFSDKVRNAGDIIISIGSSRTMQRFLSGSMEDTDIVEEQFHAVANLFSEQNMVDSVYPFVGCIYLFSREGRWVNSQAYPRTVGEEEMQTIVFRELNRNFLRSEEEYRYVVTPARIYLCTRLYDTHMKVTGSCVMTLEADAVRAIFGASDRYPEQKWMVTANDGTVLFSNDEDGQMAKTLLEQEHSGNRSLRIRDRDYLLYMEKTAFGLRSGLMVDKQNVLKTSLHMLRPFALLFLAVLSVAAVAVLLAAIRLTRPIRQMSDDLRRVSSEPEAQMRRFGIAEFDEISTLYNSLTGQIRGLVAKVYEKQLLASQAQVKFLQSQINPHFMFNILSMLSMRAALRGDKEMQRLLVAFSRLVQGKIFRKGEVEIPIAEELELAEFYLLLQSERFAGKISYEIRCEDALRTVRIPRLLIEPLVENAVAHGLEPKASEGRVTVTVQRQGEEILICIEDDGVGFCPDDPEARQKLAADEKHTHIGIENARQMLNTIYGSRAAMKIESRIGEGTRVTIRLPMKKEG